MMRCPHSWHQEIFTGVERTLKEGLRGLGHRAVGCRICGHPHYLKRIYFEGTPAPDNVTDIYALDCATSFSSEIGVLISVMAMIEGYLPELLVKLSNMKIQAAQITMGTFFNFSHKIDLIEFLANQLDDKDAFRKDMLVLASKIRKANVVRVKYAHAKYGVAHDKVHVTPFFGDARKKQERIVMTIDDICADVEIVKDAARQTHAFLYRGETPTRQPGKSP